ncbi:hypothetical protein [Actinoplanes flavus]|uniref:Uncharacterized protein n=1 Tax=Actinoplanes flavus TaxID=2820290 RepID=A0ABS3UTA5_9ACTN|nr:hypothetical protein [Actinoplanes flavus]MBO3741805.1 hypothetical protein [Actinoplanes flavus]
MSDNQYPVFASGQTLTAADLNLLRAHEHHRDRLVGRTVGFGVNVGLGGVVSGSALTIQPGLAIDQTGEPLPMPAAGSVPLPPAAMTPSYDFISTAPGGFSVVLEASDTVEPVPDCGEAGCADHAELHIRGVVLRTVAGRVSGTRMDFPADPLLSVQPLALNLDSTPVNSYNTLRDAIATRLTNGASPLVATALIARLQATSIASADLAGAKGYKAGWLNMVLFATLDLLRVEALLRLSGDRTTSPGVVLGWLSQVGGDWVFDCRYRHAWEPPRGLTEAFLGGTCTDPAGRYRSELEALLAGYAPPEPPPSGGGTLPPVRFCPEGSILIGGKCIHVYMPPREIPDRWRNVFIDDPLAPVWNPPDTHWDTPWVVYDTEGWNHFADGVIGVSGYVGYPGDAVKGLLVTEIESRRGVADIKIINTGEEGRIAGYLPAGGFSPSDTLVLTVNSAGTVVATGRVAAVRNTRDVGSALPAALGAVAEAKAAANELRAIGNTVETRFATLQTGLDGLGTNLGQLRTDFNAYKGGAFDQGGFGARIGTVESKYDEFSGHGERIATMESRLGEVAGHGERIAGVESTVKEVSKHGERISGVESKVNEVSKHAERIASVEAKVQLLEKIQVGGKSIAGVSATVGKGIADFTEATIVAMRQLSATNRDLRERTAAAERSQARLSAAIATDNPQVISAATLELLGTVSEMVKVSGAGAEFGERLDAQLRQLSGLLG